MTRRTDPASEAGYEDFKNKKKDDGKWVKISGIVDSGAVTHVTNRRTAEWIPIKETASSKAGPYYINASGGKLQNEGEKLLEGITNDGTPVALTQYSLCTVYHV